VHTRQPVTKPGHHHEAGTQATATCADLSTPTDNDLALDGLAYEMSQLGTGGFYSTPAMWSQIGGAGFDTTPPPPPTGSPPGLQASGSPVWLIQNGTAAAGGATFSADQACRSGRHRSMKSCIP
jgi:hypothetical protein